MSSDGYQEALDKRDLAILNRLEKKTEKKQYILKGAFRLLEEVKDGIRFFGKVQIAKNQETAEFICHCGEAFRSTLSPILSGKKKSCGCGKINKK